MGSKYDIFSGIGILKFPKEFENKKIEGNKKKEIKELLGWQGEILPSVNGKE